MRMGIPIASSQNSSRSPNLPPPTPPKPSLPPRWGRERIFGCPMGEGVLGGPVGPSPAGVFVWFYFDFWEEFRVFLSQFQGFSAD